MEQKELYARELSMPVFVVKEQLRKSQVISRSRQVKVKQVDVRPEPLLQVPKSPRRRTIKLAQVKNDIPEFSSSPKVSIKQSDHLKLLMMDSGASKAPRTTTIKSVTVSEVPAVDFRSKTAKSSSILNTDGASKAKDTPPMRKERSTTRKSVTVSDTAKELQKAEKETQMLRQKVFFFHVD
jgi:hypothetical protein